MSPEKDAADKAGATKVNNADTPPDAAATAPGSSEAVPTHPIGRSPEQLRALLEKLSLCGGAGRAPGHQFWNTQPVVQDEAEGAAITVAGPIKAKQKIADVSPDPVPLPSSLRWVTCDISDEAELKDIYELLYHNYVEDDSNMFRFDYSPAFLRWALSVPNAEKSWIVGVRAEVNNALVGFISGIPMELVIAGKPVHVAEVNFLCVNKQLRAKRLAPLLIMEITRRINLKGVWFAVYTAGVTLTKPFAECLYYHRPLNFAKLVETKFSVLKKNMKMSLAVRLYALPEDFTLSRIRPLRKADIPAVLRLLAAEHESSRVLYVKMSKAEAAHSLMTVPDVVSSFVRTDEAGAITDFFSLYIVPSTVVGNTKYPTIKAAYSFYNFATSVSLTDLMRQALIAAKTLGCDVFNTLDLGKNKQFLDELKFGRGDGSLKYYLYNYRVPPLQPEQIGLTML